MFSPSFLTVGCSISTACIYVISSIIMPFLFSNSFFYFSSLSLLLNLCSSFNLFFVSCSFSSTSYNLFFSLFLCSALFISFPLFTFVAKAFFTIIGSTLIFHLFSPSGSSTIFLFPLSCTGFLPSATIAIAFGVVVVCG